MVEAYVMIMTVGGSLPRLLGDIREIEGVTRANIVAGEFDIIALVEAEDNQHLLSFVTDELQSVEGVGRTKSCIVLQ